MFDFTPYNNRSTKKVNKESLPVVEYGSMRLVRLNLPAVAVAPRLIYNLL